MACPVRDGQAQELQGGPGGEAVSPPPSWEISVDRPLISGRKQGPVTRSGGWGGIPWALGEGSWGGGKKS